MALRSEWKELLAGFEKRMKFINIVRCLIEHGMPDAIREMIPDKKIVDNLVMAVLVYIKDRTLGTEELCRMEDIRRYLEDLTAILPEECHVDAGVLAKYIVVDVLQNGGILTEYLTYDSDSETFIQQPVRLLNEEKGSYHLTDDAFDFLFRSKEIETELDYSVTRFRMKEYMRRDNYEQALDASRELVSRVRNMKVSMDDFLLRCRENIARITVDQYEAVISRIRSLLENEYEELAEIQNSAQERKKTLEEAWQKGVDGEDTRRRYMALQEIIRNISLTIEEQRALINKKTTLAESYQELIRDSFVVNRFERMNFQKDILSTLQKPGAPLGDAAKYLLFMLTKPEFEKQFSVESFYAPQTKLTEAEELQGIDLTEEETDFHRQIHLRDQRHLAIVRDFFQFSKGRTRFSIHEFIETLRISELISYCEENALPNVLLSIFAMQELDLETWRQEKKFAIVPNGEFELAWCLEELSPELICMRKICFHGSEHTFRFTVEMEGQTRRIDLSDFEVEVQS